MTFADILSLSIDKNCLAIDYSGEIIIESCRSHLFESRFLVETVTGIQKDKLITAGDTHGLIHGIV